MNMLSEQAKIDIGLTSQSLNGAGTGAYYNMRDYRKALFVAEVGTMAAAATSALQVMQATDAGGTGAKVITVATDTITANTDVTTAILTSAAVHVAGEIYTINGVAYTAAAADVPGARTYAIGADQTASTANLAAKINAAATGVPGVTASAALGVLTLTATNPGAATVTLTASALATGVPSTARAIGYIEVDASYLDLANGFDHVALRVTNSAAILTGAVLLRDGARYSPTQHVAANFITRAV